MFSHNQGHDEEMKPAPSNHSQALQDQNQLHPQPLSDFRACSVAEPPLEDRLFSSPITEPREDTPPVELSMSPAAMFLSTFSPMATSQTLPDQEGETVAGYTLGPVIGCGGFSTIRRAYSLQGGTVAVKIVRRSDINKQPDPNRARETIDHEKQVWSSLSHEHILPLFISSHTPYADFFVTLYCPAGSLFDILKRDGRPALPQDDAGMMFRQVVRGLRYVHEVAGYVHGDIKLENVLVDEMGVCKIGDFGMARRIGEFGSNDDDVSVVAPDAGELPSYRHRLDEEQQQHHHGIERARTQSHRTSNSMRVRSSQQGSALPVHLSLLKHRSGPRHRNSSPLPSSSEVSHVLPNPTYQPGSLPYAAPELLLSSEPHHFPRPHPAQDIWALGVMLYALLSGRLPFVDSFEPRLQMKILHGAFTLIVPIVHKRHKGLRTVFFFYYTFTKKKKTKCHQTLFVSLLFKSDVVGAYDVPRGIGRASEPVLQGCLEKVVPKRWTIAMVDEVAWAIGWEGDDGHVPSPTRQSPHKDKAQVSSPSQAAGEAVERSRSSSRPPRRSSPAVRRSTSRSQSRSRVLPYNAQYSHHLHPHLPEVILRSISSSTTTTASSTESSDPPDSALLVSPTRSEVQDGLLLHSPVRARGRPPRPLHLQNPSLSPSRSASPLEVPVTPVDSDSNSSAGCERVRGRKISPRHLRQSPIRHPLLRRDELDTVDEQEHAVFVEDDREWIPSPGDGDEGSQQRSSARSASYDRVRGFSIVGVKSRDSRPGSMPPAPLPSYHPWAKTEMGSSSGNDSGEVSRSSPMPIPTPTRSRSAGFDTTVERMYAMRALGV